MARNHEKAQAMLNRWQRIKNDLEKGTEVRPFLSSECKTLSDAERWRMDVIKEITRKVSQIQNASLGEYRIRELNDEINKLLREKTHWERRIIELGGPDYITQAKQDALQFEGAEAKGSMGYKYFGAAKDLPGVRELFEKAPAGPAKRTRYEMHKGVTPDYYGYRDDDDGVLERYEKKVEAKIRKKVIAEWHEQQAAKGEAASADTASALADITTEEEQAGYSSLVKVPSQAQMAETLLAMKKERLRAKLGLKTPASPTCPAAEREGEQVKGAAAEAGKSETAAPCGVPGEAGEAAGLVMEETAVEKEEEEEEEKPTCAEPHGQQEEDSEDDEA